MTRTIGGPLASHLATRMHTRCRMLRLDLQDGTSIGITDHDQPLAFDLGDGSISYSPSTGIVTSDLAMSAGFETDNYEITGPISSTVTLAAVLGGRFGRARARIFEVNWKSLGSGPIRLLAGNVAETSVEGGKFRFQVRSDVDRFNQVIGRLITPYCNADFMDARCGYAEAPLSATVSAVTDGMRFTVTFSGSFANDYFNKGTVEFLTGALAGTAPVEVEDWTSGGALALFLPLADSPQIGDTLEIKRGCAKTRAACMGYSNIENFRGFPEVPGSDQVLKYQVPGDSGA